MKILEYETLDSTNDEAKRLLRQGGLKEPLCIWAHYQAAGRGTQGRVWVSEPDQCLTFTVLIPKSNLNGMSRADSDFTQRIGQRLSDVLNTSYKLDTFLKPVNDIYAYHPVSGDPRKLAGILVEGVSQGSDLLGLLLGVGLNVMPFQPHINQAIQADSKHNALPISLAELEGPVDKSYVLSCLLNALGGLS